MTPLAINEEIRLGVHTLTIAEARKLHAALTEAIYAAEGAVRTRESRERRAKWIATNRLTDIVERETAPFIMARRDGLPVIASGRYAGLVGPSWSTAYVGPGPAVEYRVMGGRKWWPPSRMSWDVAEWRVVGGGQ